MPYYSLERKKPIHQKMAPPHTIRVAELANQEGIGAPPRAIGLGLPANEVELCRPIPHPQKQETRGKVPNYFGDHDDGGGDH